MSWRDRDRERREREGPKAASQLPDPEETERSPGTLRLRSAHSGAIGSGDGPHLVPGTPSRPSAPSLAHWGENFLASRGTTWFFHLPAPRPLLIMQPKNCGWSKGPELVAMPVEAFLPMTVKLSGPLFFIYITDRRVL